ncbi:MAG: beta-propeller fold lactonase family protein [Gaiellales bacterium]
MESDRESARMLARQARRSQIRRRRAVAGAVGVLVVLAVAALAVPGFGRDSHTGAGGPAAAAIRRSTHHRSTPPKSSPAAQDPSSGTADPLNVYAGTRPGMFSPAVKGMPERVYVPNSVSGTVSVIDPRTFRVIRTFRTGTLDEHVTPGWNLRWLYVNNTSSNSLTVINPRTSQPVRTIHVPDPYNMYFTPDGTKAIVVAEALQRLDFRSPLNWRLIRSVHIPAAGPDHLDFSANGRFLLISCEYSGMLYRIDTHSMRITGSVHVSGLPVDVKLSPNGRLFYVANQGLSGVSIISARTLRVVGFIHTGYGSHGLAISRDTRHLYVANRIAGTISVISFATHRVVATWHVGASPDMLQVSPDGSQLWASNRFNNTVSVIDTHTGRVVHTISVGVSPHGLAFFPQPGRHSLGHNGVYR